MRLISGRRSRKVACRSYTMPDLRSSRGEEQIGRSCFVCSELLPTNAASAPSGTTNLVQFLDRSQASLRSLSELSSAPGITGATSLCGCKEARSPNLFRRSVHEIIELAVPARGIRFVFDLRPAACLNNDRYCRVDDIAIEKRRELASWQSLHTTRAWERRCEFSGLRFVLEGAHFVLGR